MSGSRALLGERRLRTAVASVVAVVALLSGGFLAAAPAYAADSVSISPATTTVASNALVTYTLTYSCSTNGGCTNASITVPTNNVTGNGANTDFASWVAAGTCPGLTKSTGQVSFALGTVQTGTYSCNFTVRAPNKTTLNGAKATITPTFTSSGGSFAATSSAVLNVTAARNDTLGAGVNPTNVVGGAALTLTFTFGCGTSSGDLGLSALHVQDVLPANFTFSSIATAPVALPGTLVKPAVGTTGGTITYDGDGSECLNPTNNRIVFTVTGTAAVNGVADAVGDKVCHTATSSFTYIDGVAATAAPSPASVCSTVIDLDWRTSKTGGTKTMNNRGQYKANDGTAPALYTFPGDWDGAATTTYDLQVNTSPATTGGGLSYDLKDPLPCIDTVSGAKYLSNTPGVACAHPAYIPKAITVTGFTPAVGALINLLMADGTTRTVPYVAGTGWTLPTSPAVSEIDIPPFTQEGANTFTVIIFHVTGYASTAAVPGFILSNTTTVNAYLSGTATQIKTTQGQTANILVADPNALGDGPLVVPTMTTPNSTACVERVQLSGSTMEMLKVPSKAIYVDYLAPAGVGAITVPPLTFTMTGANGKAFTSAGLTVANQVTNYRGTGRTLLEWTIPANLVTTSGLYTLGVTAFDVNLGAGCAGTFQNALTIGYGAAIPACGIAGTNQTPPLAPTGDTALDTNGSTMSGNYCGAAAPLKLTATNPGFTVDKTVQGNLDPSPIGAGGTGHVSVDGGTATYTISFSNTGQSMLANPVMYDLLPRVGDTRASSTAPRNSQFPVSLAGIGTLPAGLTVAYSQATNPCRPEVLASNAGCVDDWSSAAPSPLSKSTALRFTYAGNVPVTGGFSAVYTVSTPPAGAGNIAWNSVGTNVTAGDTLLGAAESSLTGLQAQSAQPAITKTADRSTVTAAGQPIVYTFTVTNNTAVTLTNVTVTDALVDSAASSVAPTPTCVSRATPTATCSGASTTLAAGQSAQFTATYTTTQADLDQGGISDQATASATPPTGPSLSNSTGVVAVTATQNAALTLTKTATPTLVRAAGDVVTYTYSATNSGNVTLRNLAIVERSFGGSGALSTITCPSGSLAPGAAADCTATYPVTQADLTAGQFENSAAATATSPSGATVTSPDSTATVNVDQVASLVLVKSATPSDADSYEAGQLITYSYVVSNTGNVPISGIDVNEVTFTGTGPLSAISCPSTFLAPAAQFTCTAAYTLTQADVDSGSLVNTANASGTAPRGPVVSDDSSVTTPQTPRARLTLRKTADTAFVNAAGDVIHYTFLVHNAGNVTIHAIDAEETDFSGTGTAPTITCPATSVLPGQDLSCTAAYTVTQADMDAGSIVNTAEARGLDTTDAEVASPSSTATVTVNAAPELTLVKTADVASYAAVGDPIEFTFAVTNTGNVSVADVDVDEGAFTGSGTLGDVDCATASLAPGDRISCTADYTVTQADIDRGTVSNTATATGRTDAGAVVSGPSTVTVAADATPALEVEKSVSPTTADAAGDTVTYSFRVTNSGNTTLSGIAIAESAFSGSGALATPDCGTGALAPGADRTCTATYQVTQADVDAGTVTNTAAATAASGAVTSAPSTATLTISRTAGLSLVKSASPTAPADFRAGQQITYTFVVTNTGNVTIALPGVEETTFTGTGTLPSPACPTTASLLPGAQFICTAVYVVTQADVDAGSISNSARAVGTPPVGVTPVTPPTSSVTVPEAPHPGLALVKTTDVRKVSGAGQIVTYRFAVTNTGNTTATRVSIHEGAFSGHGVMPTVDCPNGALVPGQTVSCTASYTVIPADLDGAALTNTATAVSASPGGASVVSDPSTATITDVLVSAEAPADPLPVTGGRIAWGAGIVALGLIVMGLILTVIRRRRRTEG